MILKSRLFVVLAATAASLMLPVGAHAFDVGRSRVVSMPGQPLVIDVALRNVTAQEAQSLKVSIADPAAWQSSGLTPPVALDQLQVSVQAGANETSRVIRLSSSRVSDQTVINVLLDIATDTGRRAIQSSVIVAPPPAIRVAGDQTVTVMRGDTLIGIANKFPVAGATRYQMLWALFQANPNAFISQNMNLLKAGAALNIPDAATVRAIDPAFAKAQYLAQVQAFQRMRGGNTAVSASPVDASGAPVTSAQNRGQVEPATTAPVPATEDQVRLSATPTDVAADQQTSQARALAEEQARLQALNNNVGALTGAAAVAGSAGQNNVASQDPTVTASGQTAEQIAQAATTAAGETGSTSGSAPINSTADGSTSTPTNTTAASVGSQSTNGDTTGTASSATTAVAQATDGSAAMGVGATATDTNTSSATAPDMTAGSAGQGATEPARDAVSQAIAAMGVGATATNTNTSSATAPEMTAGSAGQGATEPAQDAVSQAIAWVSNNVAASIAIVLALFALILAWALRATGREEKAQALGVAGAGLATTQQAFKEKLESIDLSLDDSSTAASPAVAQTEKPASGKPDGTA
jgi:pilus assembly protein FimV